MSIVLKNTPEGNGEYASIWRISGKMSLSPDIDNLAQEAPLEIRYGKKLQDRLVTMRTPGADKLLAIGLLHDMGMLDGADKLLRISQPHPNNIHVHLRQISPGNPVEGSRQTPITSACGICGDSHLDLDSLLTSRSLDPGTPKIPIQCILELPEQLHEAQALFASSGGLHAAALFDLHGQLLRLEEDVGRHNAVDKVIGWAYLENRLPLTQHVLMVSGRTSYEIVKKCIRARIPVLASVSAPSSLAVELATACMMTLIGFLRPPRFNVYAGPERLTGQNCASLYTSENPGAESD